MNFRSCRRFLPFLLCCTTALALEAGPRSALAPAPDWTQLAPFHETISREEFSRLLDEVYAPAGTGHIEIGEDAARIRKRLGEDEMFVLRFAPAQEKAKAPPRFWRPAAELEGTAQKPLAGLRIALDPGHLGGRWAKMEERWFQIDDSTPVTEGDMTLLVSKLAASQLRQLGAQADLVRESDIPSTGRRPDTVREAAIADLRRLERLPPGNDFTPAQLDTIRRHSELLFYRTSEIRSRAHIVNELIRPDLTICVHFNAEAWGEPSAPRLTEHNHLHLLVNGNYAPDELDLDDVRFDMLRKLLSRSFDEELAASEAMARALAAATGLPPYEYKRDNARRTGTTGYVWTRNLLANRLFHSPVLYLEPYVMNSQPVFDRIQLGDYAGERDLDGVMRKSIFREYADAIVEGVLAHYANR